MTKSQQLSALEAEFRSFLRRVFLHGCGIYAHSELAMALGRERATKGFHEDIAKLFKEEVGLLGYEGKDAPELRYRWNEETKEWVFATTNETGEWTKV